MTVNNREYDISTADMSFYERGVSLAHSMDKGHIAVILNSARGTAYSTISIEDFATLSEQILTITKPRAN